MLHADERKPKTKLHTERKSGKIPAVVYGHGVKSLAIFIDKQEFIHLLKEKGDGALIDLSIKDQPAVKVLIQDTQRGILTQEIIHLDFYRVKMDEKLRTDIRVHFIGEAPGVKAGGILIKDRDYIQIECLPKDLIQEVQVDLSRLTDIHSSITVADLSIPHGVVVLDGSSLILVSIAAIQQEKVEAVSAEEEKAKEKELIDKLGAKPEDATGEEKPDEKQEKEKKK
jgi:large subunit ribosomal protein L25